MTDIDAAADIEINRSFAQVTARIPLAGHVSQEWLTAYRSLAHKRDGLTAEAVDHPDRSWIVVRVPATTDNAKIQAALNAARGLISEADAAERAPQTAETEAVVRKWWARQRG
jgi:hypothetical protein